MPSSIIFRHEKHVISIHVPAGLCLGLFLFLTGLKRNLGPTAESSKLAHAKIAKTFHCRPGRLVPRQTLLDSNFEHIFSDVVFLNDVRIQRTRPNKYQWR